jgi:hypothetical protein
MPDRSTAVRQGMLLVCTNVDPAHEDDFNRWYDREHVNERVAIPGFVSGARYQTTRGSRRYLGLYRTTSLAVFETARYQQALQHPTAWSVTNLARMRNPMRRVCSIEMETGAGTGAWLALLTLATSATSTDVTAIARLGSELLTLDGVVVARLLVPDAALSTTLPAEDSRERRLDPLLLIEASAEAAAANAGRHAARHVGAGSDDLSLFQLMWQLRLTDLSRESIGGP